MKEMVVKKKMYRCIYSIPDIISNKVRCRLKGLEDENLKLVSEEICENCPNFESRYIEYPLTIQGIENERIDTLGLGHTCGALCEIRPCGEEYGKKTYLGIYLGDLPISIYTSFDKKTGILENRTMKNPAIFVTELKKIIYGCESWWREITSIDEMKEISDQDIENTWYVGLLKEMSN